MDSTGRVCVWTSSLVNRFNFIPPPHLAGLEAAAVALHPEFAFAVVDLNRVVYEVDLGCYVVPPQDPVKEEPVSNTIAKILSRAQLTPKFRIHSDSVAENWKLSDSVVQYPNLESRTRQLRQIAGITRTLIQQAEEAIRLLWHSPGTSASISLEKIVFTPSTMMDSYIATRMQLFGLLETEIKTDALPQFRLSAAAAYLVVGHLGARELEAAFGQNATVDDLLPLLEEPTRRRFFDAQTLLRDLPNIDKVRSALDAVATEITRLLSEAYLEFVNSLISTTPYTLILKKGGAKGIAHVGAVSEIRKYYHCDHFVGTSAGAILAVLLGAGFTDKELKEELFRMDFSQLIREPLWRCMLNLLTTLGLYTGNGLEVWLDNIIAQKLKSPFRVTLARLPFHTTVYACNGGEPSVKFDSQLPDTKEKSAAYVARCSMSIPFIFVPAWDGGLHIFDGGMKQNYPVTAVLKDAPSTQFIGLYLGSPIFEARKFGTAHAVWPSLFEANDTAQLKQFGDRTVIIDPRPIGMLKFKLSQDEKRFLFLAGQVAALDWLSHQPGFDPGKRPGIQTLSEDLKSLKVCLSSRCARMKTVRRRVLSTGVITIVVAWTFAHWRLWTLIHQWIIQALER